MKKNGFTLVELIGVIVVLGILMLVVFPNIVSIIRRTTIRINSATEKVIISAAKDYVYDNIDDFPRNSNDVYCIDIESDLIDNGYITDDMFNDKLDFAKDYKLKVKYVGSDYDYDIVESCGEEENDG